MEHLPEPRRDGTRSLEEALGHRRSVREFQPEALSREELSQLLWATQGITSPKGYRAAPSAGALYPLELYVATAEGLDHYEVGEHGLTRRAAHDLRPEMRRAALDQECITSAPAVFVFTAVYERTQREYGERAHRYVHMDVGHAAQNLLLQADALGLAGVPVAAFDDDALRAALEVATDEEPVYLVPIGRPL
jgi:SagB-type dehydrogenase family enzyme